ncbi:cytochrome c [Methylocaldum szegediense]|mgnify:CR=1 FL=1|jgi:cytochrome c5|uniref:Sulfite dehydrogenase (Cytochrome) subunit SorB n=1 Tax=Methylocaldum szegediense TaxID=73780 RepID=A0ABM9I1C9_9GAMM|nr:cytochrome c [Methylocaldum szegediense]CAI8825503.1 Sulfite dehydrogenase (Cytochrome) subunit SorB [Methylocaldum szegediense]
MKMRNALLPAVFVVATASAGEMRIELEKGAGYDIVMENCTLCHSLDYIPMHSGFMKRTDWQATVDKMVNVMGAPIDKDDIPVIVDYLTTHYGVE